MTKKLRKMGDIMFDFEDVITEMVEGHGLQHGEILSQLIQYLRSHHPEAIETYEDGTHPEWVYTHRDYIKIKGGEGW